MSSPAQLANFLPAMVARGSGRILNVASIGAFQPVPSLATYAATKAYVLSLTEALSEELRDSGITVTALCPGITATNQRVGPLLARHVGCRFGRQVLARAADTVPAIDAVVPDAIITCC